MIYITNAVESLHRSFRKIIQTRSSCPTDEGPVQRRFEVPARWDLITSPHTITEH